MKKWIAMLLTACLLLTCASAMAAGKMEVTKEAYQPQELYGTYYCYIFAEVTNTGDKNVAFGSGIYEVLNKDGEALASDNLYTCYPEVLAPGEVGYVTYTEMLSDATGPDDVSDHTLTVSGKSTTDAAPARLTSAAVFESVENGWGGTKHQVTITITNDTDATVYDARVAYGVYDAEGNLLFADNATAYNIGIPAGQSILYTDDSCSGLAEQWIADGVVPTTVNSIVYNED